MARKSSGAWYWEARNAWLAITNGRRVPLGVKGRDNQQSAQQAWHRLMGGVPPTPHPTPAPVREPTPTRPLNLVPSRTASDASAATTSRPLGLNCSQLVEAFLSGCAGRMAKGTARNYRVYLHEFLSAFADTPPLDLTPFRVEDQARRVAADRQKNPKYGRGSVRKAGWSQTYTSNYLAAVTTCFRWCVRQRLLPSNPLTGMTKPPRTSRGADAAVSVSDHTRLTNSAPPLMRDFLVILWHTGARPSEVASLTVDHLTAYPSGVIPLKAHKGAHKGNSRMPVIQGEAMDAAQRRAAEVGAGLLFPGSDGKPLTIQALGRRLTTIANRAGLKGATLYGYRHGYATEALKRGVPDAHVAALLGHQDTNMIHRHYSHLSQNAAVLRAAAQVRTAPSVVKFKD